MKYSITYKQYTYPLHYTKRHAQNNISILLVYMKSYKKNNDILPNGQNTEPNNKKQTIYFRDPQLVLIMKISV